MKLQVYQNDQEKHRITIAHLTMLQSAFREKDNVKSEAAILKSIQKVYSDGYNKGYRMGFGEHAIAKAMRSNRDVIALMSIEVLLLTLLYIL